MSRYMKISVVGAHRYITEEKKTSKEEVNKVLSFLRQKIDPVLPDKPDLIVLPETCDLINRIEWDRRLSYLKERGNKGMEMVSRLARENNCNIAYSSIMEMDEATFANSTVIIDRNGKAIGRYDKNFITIGEIECGWIKTGSNAPVIDCDFGRAACAICFDLNFEELRLKYAREKPDLILFSSQFHGGLMQSWWAYSCSAHFAGAVASGSGPSTVISPAGQLIASSTNYFDHVTAVVNLDCAVAHLDYNKEKLASAKAKYGCKIKVTDPGYLGSVLISSETDEISVNGIIEEYGIERLDDYLSRASGANKKLKQKGSYFQ